MIQHNARGRRPPRSRGRGTTNSRFYSLSSINDQIILTWSANASIRILHSASERNPGSSIVKRLRSSLNCQSSPDGYIGAGGIFITGRYVSTTTSAGGTVTHELKQIVTTSIRQAVNSRLHLFIDIPEPLKCRTFSLLFPS